MKSYIIIGDDTKFKNVDRSIFIYHLLRKSTSITDEYSDRFVKRHTFYKNWYDYFISNAHKLKYIRIYNKNCIYIINDMNYKLFMHKLPDDIINDILSLL